MNAQRLDCNAFAGTWPFQFLGETGTPACVARAARDAGITSTWVSPLDAAFNAEPYTANRWLAAEIQESAGLHLVPVFNPSLLGAWKEANAFLPGNPHIPAIRLIPSYHGYGLEESESRIFLEELPPGPAILITLRLHDRRGQPQLFQVPDIPVLQALDLAAKLPHRTFFLCGIRLGEVNGAAERWPQLPNTHIETSFLDGIGSIEKCVETVSPEHLHLGTLSPFFYPAPALGKIETADLSQQVRETVFNSEP